MKKIVLFAAACALRARAAQLALAAGEVKVGIDNFAFTPPKLTVKAGTKVMFVNHDDIPHNVIAPDDQAPSKALDTGDSFSFVFDKPARSSISAACIRMMKGKITVTP